MNRSQRIILFIAALLLLACFLFVPTTGMFRDGTAFQSGYMPVWQLSESHLYHLNGILFLAQTGAALFVSLILFFACKSNA